MVIQKIIHKFMKEGLSGASHAMQRQIRGGRIPGFSSYEDLFKGRGIEIGGPSRIFGSGHHMPIYGLAASMDNCNFARSTVWEGQILEGQSFRYDGRTGHQFIREATALSGIEDDAYDFLISSHTLEHVANPIKALKEWQRVVNKNGTLVIIVPHRDGTFDHKRDVTAIEHMISDYKSDTDESDLTHLPEIVQKHDYSRDPHSGTPEQFKARCLKNFENRCMHHHVFASRSLAQLLDLAGLHIMFMAAYMPTEIIAICNKQPNADFLSKKAHYLKNSPFKTDQQIGQET